MNVPSTLRLPLLLLLLLLLPPPLLLLLLLNPIPLSPLSQGVTVVLGPQSVVGESILFHRGPTDSRHSDATAVVISSLSELYAVSTEGFHLLEQCLVVGREAALEEKVGLVVIVVVVVVVVVEGGGGGRRRR